MSDAVLIALISGITAISSGTIAGVTASKLTIYRIEQLEKKVDKHNQLVERTYRLEERCSLQDEKIKVANHRIEDLEKGSVNA